MCPKLFDILSEDVLDLIVAEVAKDAELEELCEIRLACRDLSYVLESKLFKATTINITRPEAQSQLRIMASGNGANARWTTHLKVQSLPRAANRSQSTLLRKAIEGLRKLESAHIQFQMVSNYDVVLAVSQLPKLRSVQLLFETGWRDSAPLPPLEYFKGLHSLELSNLPLSQRAVDVLRQTITISPELQSLNILYQGRHSSLEDLASVFADAVAAPAFVPTLERLILRGRHITLSPACVPYLSALTDLQIDQCPTAHAVDPAFWEALADGRVRLQHLKLYPLSPSIVAYLKTYTGLRTLRLSGNGKDKSSINRQLHMVEALYREIIPQHRETLRELCTANLPTTVWEIEAKNLKAILRCMNLETLAVKYRYDVGKGTIDLPI
ncbi:hypothetical protein DFP72DRAFT_116535 [Ephemerocybe angulata]|uniref:Uncharacterized protein n=1 Tax=Ephemerocybe angulata TaxID=980116 RepID=A0A8H6I6F4_9AGAR|nr:hypothetical protein DFP72DRAFT_116535 [Tulosesus angulatus]